MKIHHTAIATSDIDAAIAWYTTHFPFTVTHRYGKDDKEFCMLTAGAVNLELISFGDAQQALPQYRKDLLADLVVNGTKHVCFEVHDVIQEIARLQKAGVTIAKEPETAGFGGTFAFIADLEGNLIELWSHT